MGVGMREGGGWWWWKKKICTLKRYRGLLSIPSQSRYGDLTRVKGGGGGDGGQGSGPWLPSKTVWENFCTVTIFRLLAIYYLLFYFFITKLFFLSDFLIFLSVFDLYTKDVRETGGEGKWGDCFPPPINLSREVYVWVCVLCT